MENLKEGDLVLCAVTDIDRTTVFVKLEEGEQGTIVTSEIAPGRIRNLRDYVIPGKKIVCKVLKIDEKGNINLSLRRVSLKEKQEVMEKYEKEKNSVSILKSVLGEKAADVAEKIKKESSLYEFLQNCKINPEKLEKHLEKEEAEKICKILQEKKEKAVEVKKIFNLSSKSPDGVKTIKNMLSFCKGNCEISYMAAGKYAIKIKSADYKKANQEISQSLDKIEKQAKEKKAEFQVSR